MSRDDARAVFSTDKVADLDSAPRRILYRPDALAKRYVKPGDRVLDFGCGPGFFTRSFARRVGDSGQVIAADLQPKMLAIVREKLVREGLIARLRLHQCGKDSLLLEPGEGRGVDVAFALFSVHEVPDRQSLFSELAAVLVPGGTLFYAEPLFLVGRREFRANVGLLERCGLQLIESRWYFLNRAALLRKTRATDG